MEDRADPAAEVVRLYRHVHGVEPENFPLYLVEYEFRYNHRNDHLLSLLFAALVRPDIPELLAPRVLPITQNSYTAVNGRPKLLRILFHFLAHISLTRTKQLVTFNPKRD